MPMSFDVVVVGAGQAGIEAALACARMGLRTLCVTMRLDRIGHLPCNCSIGGPAKGHLAREVDALGGQMAVATDYALTHIRRVGTGRGPSVQTVRAHVCKARYPEIMRASLEAQAGLELLEGVVLSVEDRHGVVSGVRVRTANGEEILACRSVVLTTGTFLNGLCHEGSKQTRAARHGEDPAVDLSDFLRTLGVRLRRFKTGTTPRIKKSTVDFSKTVSMPSEADAGPVSFLHDRTFPEAELLPCWQTWTNPNTHALIGENLHQSAMFSGQIEGVGPRYCPSIEDKIVRFADKESHPIFLEQEEWRSESLYVQGMSTSLPADVQLAMLRTVAGMEAVEMIRPGYAVEYDMADPLQLTPHLMSKLLPGLFLAGQLNGTSGYEEAAGQGLVAGINAGRFARVETPVDFPRSQSFLGVMVDDLVTKGVEDPYRMLTARAEHRLTLRHDNADLRLTPLGREVGTVDDARWDRFRAKRDEIAEGLDLLAESTLTPADTGGLLETRASLFSLMLRPEIGLNQVLEWSEQAGRPLGISPDPKVREQLELNAKYDGYLRKETRLLERAQKLEGMRIPSDFAYDGLKGLSHETVDKLTQIRPSNIGQASRVPGVRPTDIALLVGHLRSR